MVLTTPESIIEQASTAKLLDDLIDESVRTSARRPIMMQFDPSSGFVRNHPLKQCCATNKKKYPVGPPLFLTHFFHYPLLSFCIVSLQTCCITNLFLNQYHPYHNQTTKKPQIWRQWKGTVFSVTWKSALRNMVYALLVYFVYKSQAPLFNQYLSGIGTLWGQLLSVTTFTLTFFVNQSYALWRKCNELSRRIQGRLHDINLNLSSHAARKPPTHPNEPSRYTAASRQILELMGRYVRLFNLLTYASFTRSHRPILTPRGMRRLVERGLMTAQERQILVDASIPATQRNSAILIWMIRLYHEGRMAGHIEGGSGFEQQTMEKFHVLRAQYGSIGDELQGRMPLAYAHIVQILVDLILWMYPIMALSVGMSPLLCVLGTGLLTTSYQGLFDLAKQFLDPYDNENYGSGEDPLCVDTLIAETNAGSVRWMNAFEEMPFSAKKLQDGELHDSLLPVRGYSVDELIKMEEEKLQRDKELEEQRIQEEAEQKQKLETERQQQQQQQQQQQAAAAAQEQQQVVGEDTTVPEPEPDRTQLTWEEYNEQQSEILTATIVELIETEAIMMTAPGLDPAGWDKAEKQTMLPTSPNTTLFVGDSNEIAPPIFDDLDVLEMDKDDEESEEGEDDDEDQQYMDKLSEEQREVAEIESQEDDDEYWLDIRKFREGQLGVNSIEFLDNVPEDNLEGKPLEDNELASDGHSNQEDANEVEALVRDKPDVSLDRIDVDDQVGPFEKAQPESTDGDEVGKVDDSQLVDRITSEIELAADPEIEATTIDRIEPSDLTDSLQRQNEEIKSSTVKG
jgi:predicted membrane chloride channel (bestrophin family)